MGQSIQNWFSLAVLLLLMIFVVSEVAAFVLPELDPTSPFGRLGSDAVTIGAMAFGILIFGLGGLKLYNSVTGGFGSR